MMGSYQLVRVVHCPPSGCFPGLGKYFLRVPQLLCYAASLLPRKVRGTPKKWFTKPAKRPDGGECICLLQDGTSYSCRNISFLQLESEAALYMLHFY